MRYGAVNEEEFIEAERKRIGRIYMALGLLLLVLPMVIVLIVMADAFFLWLFPLLFSIVPVLFLLSSLGKKGEQGLWYSSEKLSGIHLRGLSIFFIMAGAGIMLAGVLFAIRSGIDYMTNPLFIVSFLMLFLFVFSSILAVKYVEKEMHRKLEKFEMRRNIVLGIPVDSAKEVIKRAVTGLRLEHSEFVPRSKFDVLWHIELESGMRIYALTNFKNSRILIARIHKGDTIEPKIEAEILRLANERVHMQESDK